MKKLFFILACVVCFSSSAISQRIFVDNSSAIEALKVAPQTLMSVDVSTENASDLAVLNSLKRNAANSLITMIVDFGNSQDTYNQYFSQAEFQNPRIDPAMVAETREFILNLISKEQ